MSIEEIAAKGILGLKAPPPKIAVEPIEEEATDNSPSSSSTAYATDVVSLAIATPADESDANDDEKEVPISTDSLPIHLDDVPLPLDDVDEVASDEFIEVNEAVVVEVEKEEIEPNMTKESEMEKAPDYTAKPKRHEMEPIHEEVEEETKTEEIESTLRDENEVDMQPTEQFEQPTIILDAPSSSTTTTTTSNNADVDGEDTPLKYEEVSAEDYEQEFNIVLERCNDGSGFASNDGATDADDAAKDKSVKEDFTANPCVRLEPTFVGCTDANLFGASNPFDSTVIKTTVAFNYDLYLQKNVVVNKAVSQLEETMLQHVAGGMNFDRCGANDDTNGEGRKLAEDEKEDNAKTEEIGFVGLSSRPVDVEDPAYQQCTSNLTIEGDVSEPETKCVPMKGKMTVYLSSKDDRFAAKHLIIAMVRSGADSGSFVGAGNTEAGILGVAYVEHRALESAKLPGNNLEQFKASAGMSGLAIGLVSFLGVFVSCFAFGLVGLRRHEKQNSEPDDSFDEEADNADLVKGEDGSFPNFPQLAKITPSNAELEEDLESPEVPIPTMTNTTSSELLSVASADLGCHADDSTVDAANPKEDEGIHCVPLPPPALGTYLSENDNNDQIPGIQTTGSTEFGKQDESDEEDSLPCISTAGSMAFGTEMFSPIKFPGRHASGEENINSPEGPKVSEERRLKAEVLLGQSPPFYGN